MNKKEVYALTKKVPRGRVTTYGEIAKALGNVGYSRAVGGALNKNRYKEVPCHRVVYSDGRLGGFRAGVKKKTHILRKEGIKIEGGRVKDFEAVVFRF